MRRFLLLPTWALLVACPRPAPPPPPEEPQPVVEPVRYANPRMGTGGFGYNFGSAFPGACAPNGMAKVGPDTKGPYGTINFLHYSGYWDGDDTILGFSHLHLHGTGATDYGIISVMPTTTPVDTAAPTVDDVERPFLKDTEVAEPGYYAVKLEEVDIHVELTATTRTAHHRITFPATAQTPVLVIDLGRTLPGGEVTGSELTVLPGEQRIRGRVHHVGNMSNGFGGYDVFFEMRTRQAWGSQLMWREGVAPSDVTQMSGRGIGVALTWDGAVVAPVELQVGLSFVSAEGARANLEGELPAWDFDGTRAATRGQWDALLSRARVFGGTEAQRRTFYSNLHHAFMMPSILEDVTGLYRGHDGQDHASDGFNFVTDLSLWDTYRTLNPLYSLLTPEKALDVVRSLHEMAKQSGFFPKWPIATGEAGTMIGASAEIVVADAYVKGVTGFDVQDVYARMRAAAMDSEMPTGGRGGRNHVERYMQLGFVPEDERPSVSLTTEYAHADFALAQLARALGREADADALLTRSRGYRRLHDSTTGFLRAHTAEGSLAPREDFDPAIWDDDYAEANAWQSVWMAAHDVDGLAELMGGSEALVAKLVEFFERAKADHEALDPENLLSSAGPRPYYFHGNEPDIHAAYLFSQLGRRDLAAKWIHWVRTTFHHDGPTGLYGNDDGGTLGAWYVFSALGFYPLPGSDRYILGTPLFPKVELAVDGGVFTVEAAGLSDENIVVQSVELNGQALNGNEFRHAELRAGGKLRFVMGK
ncbi:MAG: GH92 family glycosyl hydrolase [Myxococcota bacterium]